MVTGTRIRPIAQDFLGRPSTIRATSLSTGSCGMPWRSRASPSGCPRQAEVEAVWREHGHDVGVLIDEIPDQPVGDVARGRWRCHPCHLSFPFDQQWPRNGARVDWRCGSYPLRWPCSLIAIFGGLSCMMTNGMRCPEPGVLSSPDPHTQAGWPLAFRTVRYRSLAAGGQGYQKHDNLISRRNERLVGCC